MADARAFADRTGNIISGLCVGVADPGLRIGVIDPRSDDGTTREQKHGNHGQDQNGFLRHGSSLLFALLVLVLGNGVAEGERADRARCDDGDRHEHRQGGNDDGRGGGHNGLARLYELLLNAGRRDDFRETVGELIRHMRFLLVLLFIPSFEVPS